MTAGKPYCCEVSCSQDAVVRIFDTRPETPYDVAETHACADHVYELGGGEPYAEVYRFDGPDPTEITLVDGEIDGTEDDLADVVETIVIEQVAQSMAGRR